MPHQDPLIPEILPPTTPGDQTLTSPPPRLTPTTLQPFIEQFLEEARLRNRPESTKGYEKSLARFFKFWQGPGKSHTLTSPLCFAFRTYLETEGLSPNTQQVYLSALRLFMRWLQFRKVLKWNPMEGVHSPPINPIFKKQPLSLTEVGTLLETVKEDTLLHLRDKAILYLLLKTGIREIEVIRANAGDFQTTPKGQILRVQGKGRKDKDNFVVIMPEVKALLDTYLTRRMQEQRPRTSQSWPDPSEPLFTTLGKRPGQRLKPATIHRLVYTWLTTAQLKRPVITGHSLRHTAATMALEGGAPIMAVKDMLRHSSIKQTNIYVHTLDRIERGGESYITQY